MRKIVISDSACRERRSEVAGRHRDEFTTPGGIHVRRNERTFLQFLSSHCLTPSSWVRTSGASKNLALGPPSFFGPNDNIFHRFLTMKRDDPDQEATRRAQTWHASEVGCGCTGRTAHVHRSERRVSTVRRWCAVLITHGEILLTGSRWSYGIATPVLQMQFRINIGKY